MFPSFHVGCGSVACEGKDFLHSTLLRLQLVRSDATVSQLSFHVGCTVDRGSLSLVSCRVSQLYHLSLQIPPENVPSCDVCSSP